jgi:uncharacterized damage-inducible protein DinB
MMNLNALREFYRHMEWADATVWTSVMASSSGRTDEKLRSYLYHLHLVQYAFLKAWRGGPLEAPKESFDDTQSLLPWARAYYGQAMAHLESLDEEKLSDPMPLAWAKMVEKALGRAPETPTIGETILQVALHSLYHRGQVNARLSEVGGKPPLVDYIAWVWFARPAPEWPSGEQTP